MDKTDVIVKVEPNDICYLCGQKAVLRLSHIVPRFVFDWLKNTSGTGSIRRYNAPNLRVQDGLKKYLLCDGCEQLFNRWETPFKEEIFLPLHEERAPKFIEYGEWLEKFAVSISWRVLTYFKLDGLLSDAPPNILDAADRALKAWKEFLLDQRPHPGRFEQHLLPLSAIIDTSESSMPPTINRYLLRSVHVDVTYGERIAIVYAKICHILLVGFIEMPHPKDWEGTKLHVKDGTLQIRDKTYVVPDYLGDFVKDSARKIDIAMKTLSKRQKKRIEESYMQDLDRAAESESFRATNYDVILCGERAFEDSESEDDE